MKMEFNINIMKKLLILSLILQLYFLNAQVVIQQPELNILYRGYDNLLIPEAEGAEENKISADGAIVTPTKFKGRNGFLVRPQGTKVVSILHEAKINGEWKKFDTTFYKVKPFPTPCIMNQYVSKSSGANIRAGYPEGTPIENNFEVVSMNLYLNGEIAIGGSVIPPELVKNIEPGKNIGGTATIRNITTGGETQVSFTLKITR
jgi:hypothetical protein